MKLRMSEKSLFATLLRSPWWVSAVIALALGMASFALLPADLRVVGALSGLPFVVIAVIALRRQWHLPGPARVAATQAALAAMAWPGFAELLEQGFRRDGYVVERSESAGVDFVLERKGRRQLVCARRWKSARTGLEALRALQAAREKDDDAPDALYIGLAELTDTARAFAAEHRIIVWHAGALAHALRGLPLGGQRIKA